MTLQNPFDISCVPPPPPVEIAGCDSPEIAWRLIHDVVHSLSGHTAEPDDVRADKMNAAVAMIKAMKPRDALEAQLITQIVCAHNLATEDMHRANIRGTPQAEIDARLRSVTRFMTLFRQQTKTLITYRGTPWQMKLNAQEEAHWEWVEQREATIQQREQKLKRQQQEQQQQQQSPPAQ